MSVKKKIIPNDPVELLIIFRKLCEDYADEADAEEALRSNKHRRNLLDFCHAYAYKINGIENW